FCFRKTTHEIIGFFVNFRPLSNTKCQSRDVEPQLNNSGQIVWSHGYAINSEYEIFFFDNGQTSALTNNSFEDRTPRINDNGEVVWIGGDEVFYYNGTSTRNLSIGELYARFPQFNNNGSAIWFGWDGDDYEVYLFDGTTTVDVTANSVHDTYPDMNAGGQVVWAGFDGEDYEIYLKDSSGTIQLTNNAFDDTYPQINANGDVAWVVKDGDDAGIYLATPLPDWEELGPSVYGSDLVSDGGALYRIGGIGHCNDIYMFNETNNSWQLLTAANPQCWAHYSPGEGNRSWMLNGRLVVAGHSHPGHPGGNNVTVYEPEANTWSTYELPVFNSFSWGQFGALNSATGLIYLSWTDDWGSGHDYATAALDIEFGWEPTYDRSSRIGNGAVALEDTSGQFVFDLIRGDQFVQLGIYDLSTQPDNFSGNWRLSSACNMGTGDLFMVTDRNYGSDVMAWNSASGKLYLVATQRGTALEYNPVTDSWRRLNSRPSGDAYRDGHVAVANNYLYAQNGNRLWRLLLQ
ncbi:MAG: hypothetical protein JXR76_05360, partial [Deltaproteobacteria bacterium]|nr:hypothetical protein [Deltaproteobacteria bacterium]